MPAVVIERLHPQSEEMWQALKVHIQRERQRKKQEQEADAENERQRKERELQQKQDVMTLGETREQILVLEQRLSKLKEEKHELFMQLKKVLNEDEYRRRQMVKESNEVLEMYNVTLGNHQLFLQQNMPVANRNQQLYKVPPPHNLLPASGGSLKRSCSPSPPPSTGYNHPSYGYKPNQAPPSSSYQKAPPEDNRRGHEYVRAVLWNKNNQYGPFYPTSTTLSYSASAAPAPSAPVQTIYTYAGQFAHAQPPPPPPSSSGGPPPPPQSQVRAEPPPPPQESQPPPPQPPPPSAKHPTVYMTQSRAPISQAYLHGPIDHNKPGYPEDKYYSVAPIRPATHVSLHGGSIPIQQPPQGAKTGGITSGYPIRPPSSAPHPISSAPNQVQHSVYVSQAPSGSRLVYSSAGIPQPSNAPPGRYAISNMQREV